MPEKYDAEFVRNSFDICANVLQYGMILYQTGKIGLPSRLLPDNVAFYATVYEDIAELVNRVMEYDREHGTPGTIARRYSDE